MFHDTIPEEREEQHKKLIVLLRRGLREPVSLSSSEQSQIIDRVRERLTQVRTDLSRPSLDYHQYWNWQTDAINRSLPSIRRMQSQSSRRGYLLRLVNSLVAVLVVGILIGAALLLFRPSLHQNAAPPPTDTTGPTAHTQVNGLEATIHLVTPGPYFLSELVAVDVSLTNHTRAPFGIDGSSRVDIACFSSAMNVQFTGGRTPFYTLPRLDIACLAPLFLTTLAPGQTLTMHYYLPVTESGEVTIMMTGMGGAPVLPLVRHWPSLRIHVNPQVPANRVLALHEHGAQVIIQAPPAARTHLLYRESISCDGYLGLGEGLADWSPLSTTTLSQPACPTAHKHWVYIVSAPGYAIATGNRNS